MSQSHWMLIFLFALSNQVSAWTATETVSCYLVQMQKEKLDFFVDVRLDPTVLYRGGPTRTGLIQFYLKIGTDRVLRDAMTVPICSGADWECTSWFIPSRIIEREMDEGISKARRGQGTTLLFEFHDTDAQIVLVRTRMCGDFTYDYQKGLWEHLDGKYFCGGVRLSDEPHDDETEKCPHPPPKLPTKTKRSTKKRIGSVAHHLTYH